MTSSHPQAYQKYNNGLLFQFILVQFIEIYTAVQRLETIFHRKPTRLDKEDCCSGYLDSHYEEVENLIRKLIGTAHPGNPFVSWNFDESLLSKLKSNCTLLLNNSESNVKELLTLQHYAEKLYTSCLGAADALKNFSQSKELLLAAIDKISGAMQRLAKLMARFIPLFREDENVIFCVLCHKESLDRLFGPRFVAKMLSKMYPKGLTELHSYIAKRYGERGFNNILPAITNKIAELEVASL